MTRQRRFQYVTEHADQHSALSGMLDAPDIVLQSLAGLDGLRNRPPDLLFIDATYPGAVNIVRDLRQNDAHLPIIAIAGADNLRELRQIMLAGAQSFLTLPFIPADVADTLDVIRKTPRHVGGPNGNLTIAVTSLKGGVGKSTISTNLAVAIQQYKNKDVILVEGHHGLSDLALMLNVYPPHTLSSLADRKTVDADMVEGLLHRHNSGIRLLAAPTSVSDMVELSAETWRSLLSVLKSLSDVLIIDTAPTADIALAQVLGFADHALVVSSPEMPGLRRALDVIEAMHADTGQDIETHLLLNRADMPGGIRESDISNKSGAEVAMTLPYDPTLTTYALNRGIPFILSHPRSRLSHRIVGLADMLMPEPEPEQSHSSSLSLPSLNLGIKQRFSSQTI